jgi:hypothetical protein
VVLVLSHQIFYLVKDFEQCLQQNLSVCSDAGYGIVPVVPLFTLVLPFMLIEVLNFQVLMIASSAGKFHDQGDAKWIVIRGRLRGHNDTPFGRPAPGWPIGPLVVGRPQGVFGGLSYY